MCRLTVSLGLVWLFLALGACAVTPVPPAGPYAETDNDTVHRLFVTKVYPGHGLLSRDDFQQLAEAGFTTVVARWKDNIPAYAHGAAAVGLDSMSWEGGMVSAETLKESHTVTYKGVETRYGMPYSPAAWQNRTELLVTRAQLSLSCPSFTGVILDFEIYDRNKTNGFAESYDQNSFVSFLAERSLPVPDPITPASRRKSYLKTRDLLDQYIAWQYQLVAAEVVRLREAVDAINPNFQIGVYGWGPMIEAVMENVATPAAPVLLINAATYGRATYGSMPGPGYNKTRPDRPALKWSLISNARAAGKARQLPYPAVFLGGHDPQVVGTGDAYKLTVRQAFNSVAYGPGYWIWTEWAAPEGWRKQEWIDAMMDYFKLAHAALDARDLTWASRQPVQIADPDATVPLTILTTDETGATVKAWDPLTGRQITVNEDPEAAWITTAMGDVDAIAGDERVDLADGWVRVSDPKTNALLLRFYVGQSQRRMQLIKATPQKLRVLVDKVLTRGTKTMTDEQAGEIANAGFNVVSPRYAATDEQSVRAIAEIAQRHGLGYMPWIRGTLSASQEPKLVWANGVVQDICSPNSEELWQSFTARILTFARISAEYPALRGVFLDYEIYAPNKQGTAYGLSYDLRILQEFAQATKTDIPELAPDCRMPWLIENDHHDDFARFQIDSWRQRCRRLRRAIDQLNPQFQFCIYPGGSTFIEQGLLPELASRDAPAIIADPSTYSRPSALLNHHDALETNRNYIRRLDETTRQSVLPLLCMGGIDPILSGADPEFCGKNASMLAQAGDGYWIFYELRKSQRPNHPAYWEWFSKANHEIAEGEFTLWQQPRLTPDSVTEDRIIPKTDRTQLAVYGLSPKMQELAHATGQYEVHTLGGLTLEYLKQFRLVVLQNFNVAATADSKLCQTLRTYVEQGGSLLFTHDTIWHMDSPFPEIATRDVPSHALNVESGRHVFETPLKTTLAHEAIAEIPVGTTFDPAFRDHMIFKPGPAGTVILDNAFGDPVYVVGECGKGRVVFSGCYYGYHNVSPEGAEKRVFLALVEWLTTDD